MHLVGFTIEIVFPLLFNSSLYHILFPAPTAPSTDCVLLILCVSHSIPRTRSPQYGLCLPDTLCTTFYSPHPQPPVRTVSCWLFLPPAFNFKYVFSSTSLSPSHVDSLNISSTLHSRPHSTTNCTWRLLSNSSLPHTNLPTYLFFVYLPHYYTYLLIN